MGMTRANLVRNVAMKCNQWSGTAMVDGALTSEMVQVFLQNRYDELFQHMARHHRADFERTTLTNTGTSAETTTSGVYDLEAIISNSLMLNWVGIKFASTDADYLKMEQVSLGDEFSYSDDTDIYSQADPKYFLTNTTVATVVKKAIRLLPRPTTDVTSGLKLIDIQKPTILSDTIDVTNMIPEVSHWYIAEGALIDAYEVLGGTYSGRILAQQAKWNGLKGQIVEDYIPKAMDKPRRVKMSRRSSLMRRREI